MKLDLTTPALLFPAISLLLLAYGNRFLTIATLIRSLHQQYRDQPDPRLLSQIDNLSVRVRLIRNMQFLGMVSFLLCVLCMALLFGDATAAANYVFGGSLLLLMGSLALSAYEIQISTRALNIQLGDLREQKLAARRSAARRSAARRSAGGRSTGA